MTINQLTSAGHEVHILCMSTGSESVASWQENLFFEPSKFEVARSLEFLLSKYLEDSMLQENAQTLETIKEELAAIAPTLEMLWKQKDERIKKFSNVQTQIQKNMWRNCRKQRPCRKPSC